jgi:hypothetical protein
MVTFLQNGFVIRQSVTIAVTGQSALLAGGPAFILTKKSAWRDCIATDLASQDAQTS